MIKTKRLVLRDWIESDYLPFAEMNSDLEVMEHFPKRLNKDESDKMIQYCSEKIKSDGFVSLTAKTNERSQKVMQRIGMTTNATDNFEHPKIIDTPHLKPHVLYRLTKEQWEK